ncbi:MAG: hypothetical protein RLY70_2029 [Planctomycetota bacterium]
MSQEIGGGRNLGQPILRPKNGNQSRKTTPQQMAIRVGQSTAFSRWSRRRSSSRRPEPPEPPRPERLSPPQQKNWGNVGFLAFASDFAVNADCGLVARRSFYRCRVRDDRTAIGHCFETQGHGVACERYLGLPAIGNSRSLRSRKVDGILPRGSLLSVALSPFSPWTFFWVRSPLSGNRFRGVPAWRAKSARSVQR